MKIFDGHIDTLTKLFCANQEQEKTRSFFIESDHGHIDLPRAKKGQLSGAFCAIMIPPPKTSPERDPYYGLTITKTGYDVTPRSALEYAYANDFAKKIIDFAHRLEKESQNTNTKMKIVRTASELDACLENNIFAVVLHLEGAAAIKKDLSNLKAYYHQGLRSIGPVWSRPNAFGHGVPYKFPHSPDTGLGLTQAGKDLVCACNELGIIIDLAHINEQGFWDVAQTSKKPLVVSHTGVHTLCPSTRNLTDSQIDAVGKSSGVIGILFETLNIRSNGMPNEKTPLAKIVEHIDYVVKRIGIDHVALGSDFDGADMPEDLSDVSLLQNLIITLDDAGYSDNEIEKLAHKNWMRVMHNTWKK